MSLRADILALMKEHLDWPPARIAAELQCKRNYVNKVLAEERERAREKRPKKAAKATSHPAAAGGGSGRTAGYLRLM